MKWFKKEPKTPQEEPVENETGNVALADVPVKDLSYIIDNYDVVDVVHDNGDSFLVVTKKQNTSLDGINDGPDNTYSFIEPSASDRAAGANVSNVPSSQGRSGARSREDAGPRTFAEANPNGVNLNELGSSSPSPYVSFARRDYNADLIGLSGLKIYDKMRRNDGTVRGQLRAVKTPPLAARWFMAPKDKTKAADVNAAEWIWDNLNTMSTSFMQVITESLLMCEFGYYMFEIVWQESKDPTGQYDRLSIKKLAPRHPMDVESWEYDANGGVNGAWFYTDVPWELQFIPIEKLIVFTFDREAGDITGISLLRSAYKHWYFIENLYKIDAIQKERHGIGVPIIELPPGFGDQDKQLANELGRNLRTNDRAHVVLPPLWKLYFAKLEGQVVNALESIKEHKDAMRENILLQFMDPSHATSDNDEQLFLKATRFVANIIVDVFNLYLIPKIVEANFSRVGCPKLTARRIGENGDQRTLSFTIRNLIGCGALRPDDHLEDWLREEFDMPEVDLETVRNVVNLDIKEMINENAPDTSEGADGNPKQSGSKAGLPRQSKMPNAPGKNASSGTDKSGG